ncbi:glycosyltransferase [Aequorivita sinensis]|uniref:glycosyltransferase n=1 Tax=Aequorivita sinensis TaxID=1382458 RepID=UPI002301D473|nr:glycosyltransferase [Aequorivita sinensis]
MYTFIVHIDDFDISLFSKGNLKKQKLTASTSVNQLKFDFYRLLSKIGKLIQIDDSFTSSDIASLCEDKNTIYTAVHGNPPKGISCKFLSHSLGGFMVSGGFLGEWEFRNATINVVTSKTQEIQLKKSLKQACPNIAVVTPTISRDTFYTPSEEEKAGIRKNEEIFSLIYAGRFISNKGIAQLVRALNIWPSENTCLTLVGDIEPDFFIYHSNAYHTTFPNFFSREIIKRSPNLKIQVHSSVPAEQLKNLYWKSDCFVYPSFHEDENFGYAPREAMLCGIPSIVTDFCGLGQLKGSKAGIVKTYPTLGGVRYSLNELRQEIEKIKSWSNDEKELNISENISFVREECNEDSALVSLKRALNEQKDSTQDMVSTGCWRSIERFNVLMEKSKPFFNEAIQHKDELIPQGLYVDGTGSIPEGGWFSEAHFMQAVQSIYTTIPLPPKVQIDNYYRGFWRIALWKEELAIVEFGFPGPRIKRYNKKDWDELLASSELENNSEVVFMPKNNIQIELLQNLVELGYLVPDNL